MLSREGTKKSGKQSLEQNPGPSHIQSYLLALFQENITHSNQIIEKIFKHIIPQIFK